MFLRGMPHLCEKMRRLTNKDTAARKKHEDEPAPDFYALSRAYPLPDTAPVAPTMRQNPSRQASTQGLLDMETALLERRRADLLDRVNLLASSSMLRPDAMSSFSMQGGLPNASGMLRGGMMFDGLGGSGLGGAGLGGAGFAGAGLGGAGLGGAGLGPSPAPAPTHSLHQLLGARQPSPEMAQLLAMNNAGMGMSMAVGGGVPGGMGGIGSVGASGMGLGGVGNFVGGSFNM